MRGNDSTQISGSSENESISCTQRFQDEYHSALQPRLSKVSDQQFVQMQTDPKDVFEKGLHQINEGLKQKKFPEAEEGNLVMSSNLNQYHANHGKDFLKAFAEDSNFFLKQSDLGIQIRAGDLRDERAKKALGALAEQSGSKILRTGLMEVVDKQGKVTDKRAVAVFETKSGGQHVTMLKY